MGGLLFGYVVLVTVSAAFLVAMAWSIHALFWRHHFGSPSIIGAPQLSYMREVRHRELQQLVQSNGHASSRESRNFHDDFVDEACMYSSSLDLCIHIWRPFRWYRSSTLTIFLFWCLESLTGFLLKRKKKKAPFWPTTSHHEIIIRCVVGKQRPHSASMHLCIAYLFVQGQDIPRISKA